MLKVEFARRFNQAALLARKYGQAYVEDVLPESLVFDFAASKRVSEDSEGLIKFLGGRRLKLSDLVNVMELQAVKFLWVNKSVPVWINLMVDSIRNEKTVIQLTASSQLTADETMLYHHSEGNPPFHILSPRAPANWISLTESGKFRLIDIKK